MRPRIVLLTAFFLWFVLEKGPSTVVTAAPLESLAGICVETCDGRGEAGTDIDPATRLQTRFAVNRMARVSTGVYMRDVSRQHSFDQHFHSRLIRPAP